MNYNKNEFVKVNDKKVLHKVKKQWVTISIAMLGMLGLGAISYTSVSAHQTQQPATLASRITKNLNSAQGRKMPQDKEYNVNNPQFIGHQAKNLHAHLMRLSALSDDDNAKNNLQKTSAQDKSEQNDNRVDQQKNNSANVPNATFTGDNNVLSLTVVFHDNQSGKNYSDTWKADPGELIIGPPNGTKYQLAGQQGQPYLYHFSDVDHLHPLNSYTKRNPNIPSNDPKNVAFIPFGPSNGPSNGGKGGNGGHNGDNNNTGYNEQKYSITPQIHFDHPNKTVSAHPIQILGNPGEIVKIPFSDIYTKSDTPVDNDPNYQIKSDNSPLHDNNVINEDENYAGLIKDGLFNEPKILPSDGLNRSDDSIMFNQSDNLHNRKYLIVHLGDNPNGNGSREGRANSRFDGTGTVNLKYVSAPITLNYQVVKSNGGQITSDDGNGGKLPHYTYPGGSISGRAGAKIPFDQYLLNTLNHYGVNDPAQYHVLPSSDSSANVFPDPVNHATGGSNTSNRTYTIRIFKGSLFTQLSDKIIMASYSDTNPRATSDNTLKFKIQGLNNGGRRPINSPNYYVGNSNNSQYANLTDQVNAWMSKHNAAFSNSGQVTESDQLESDTIPSDYEITDNKLKYDGQHLETTQNGTLVIRYKRYLSYDGQVPFEIGSDRAGIQKPKDKLTPENYSISSTHVSLSDVLSNDPIKVTNLASGLSGYQFDNESKFSNLTYRLGAKKNPNGTISINPQWCQLPSARSNRGRITHDYDYQANPNQPILRYASQIRLPVILKDQNGNSTYAYVTTSNYNNNAYHTHLISGQGSRNGNQQEDQFSYVSGRPLPSDPSDFRLTNGDSDGSDYSVDKFKSADIFNDKATGHMGRNYNSDGFWSQPSDQNDQNWVAASEWRGKLSHKGETTWDNNQSKVPVLYYYNYSRVKDIKQPDFKVGSDYQTNNYHNKNWSDHQIDDRFIYIKTTDPSKSKAKHIIENKLYLWHPGDDGSHDVDETSNQDGILSDSMKDYFNSDSKILGHTLDKSDESTLPSGVDNPNDASYSVKYNGNFNSAKVSDILNSTKWSAVWNYPTAANKTRDSSNNRNKWSTPNWFKDSKGNWFPIIRYVPKVNQQFKVWYGSDNQTQSYTPAYLHVTADARKNFSLRDILDRSYSQDSVYNVSLTNSKGDQLSDWNVDASTEPNTQVQMSSDRPSDRINDKNASHTDQNDADKNAQKDSDDVGHPSDTLKSDYYSNIMCRQKDNPLVLNSDNGVKEYNDNINTADQNKNGYNTSYWASDGSKNAVNSQVPNGWSKGNQIPIIRHANDITVNLPVSVQPDPINYTDEQPNYSGKTYQGYVKLTGEINTNGSVSFNYGNSNSDSSDMDSTPVTIYGNDGKPLRENYDIDSFKELIDAFIAKPNGQGDADKTHKGAESDTQQWDLKWQPNGKNEDYSLTLDSKDGSQSSKSFTIPGWIRKGSTIKYMVNGQSAVSTNGYVPILRYLPQYRTPNMYQDERYWAPKEPNGSNDYKKIQNDLKKYLNDQNVYGDNGLLNHLQNESDANFTDYLDAHYQLKDGQIKPSTNSSKPPYLFFPNDQGHQNAYFQNKAGAGFNKDSDSVIGNLFPLINSNVNNTAFNTDYSNSVQGPSYIEISANGVPRVVTNINDGNQSDKIGFNTDHRFPMPSNEGQNKDSVYGVQGTSLYHSLKASISASIQDDDDTDNISIYNDSAGFEQANMRISLGSDGHSETLNRVNERNLFYPKYVNPLFITTKDGSEFPCTFKAGHYYAPKIEGDSADYAQLTPLNYTFDKNHNRLQKQRDGSYQLPTNDHVTHLKNYDIKFLNSSGELDPRNLTESGPVFEAHVIAPVGSQFHFYPKNEVLYETDPQGNSFAVACLNASDNKNQSLLYKVGVSPSQFNTDINWQVDSMNTSYDNYAGDGYNQDLNDSKIPEDMSKTEYNWRTTSDFSFTPSDPAPDKNNGYYAEDPTYPSDDTLDNKPDFKQKLQWGTNYTNGPSYLDGITTGERNLIPLYVHPNPNKEINVDVQYINLSDGNSVYTLPTKVLKDPKNFNILSYVPTYIDDGQYVIDKKYTGQFYDPEYAKDQQPVFRYVVANEEPHYYNGKRSLTAYIFLSKYSSNDPRFYSQKLPLNVKYVDADTGKPISQSALDGSKSTQALSDHVSDNSDNPRVYVDKSATWKDFDYKLGEHPITSDGVTHPMLFDMSDKNTVNGKVYDSSNHEVSATFHSVPIDFKGDKYNERVLSSLDDLLQHNDDNGKLSTLTKLSSKGWTPLHVSYYSNILDDNSDNVSANANKGDTSEVSGVYNSPIFQDYGFPSSIQSGASNKQLLYDDLGSAFLRHNIVISLYHPKAEGYVNFVDEDNFHDETSGNLNINKPSDLEKYRNDNGSAVKISKDTYNAIKANNEYKQNVSSDGNGNYYYRYPDVGVHLIQSDNGEPMSFAMSDNKGDVNSNLTKYLNQFKSRGLEFDKVANGPLNAGKGSDQTTLTLNDGSTVKVDLQHFAGKAMYTVFLKHAYDQHYYHPINISQNVLARFVYSDGNGHVHDVPRSDVPAEYQDQSPITPNWYRNAADKYFAAHNLYRAAWFNNGQPNVETFKPTVRIDKYHGSYRDNNNNSATTFDNSNPNAQQVYYPQSGNYIPGSVLTNSIKGYTTSDIISSLIFGTGGQSALDNVISPSNYDHFDNNNDYRRGNNRMMVIPPYNAEPSDQKPNDIQIKNDKVFDPNADRTSFRKILNNLAAPKSKDNPVGLSDPKLGYDNLKQDEQNNQLSDYFTELDKQEQLNPDTVLRALASKSLTKYTYQVVTYKINAPYEPIEIRYHNAVSDTNRSDMEELGTLLSDVTTLTRGGHLSNDQWNYAENHLAKLPGIKNLPGLFNSNLIKELSDIKRGRNLTPSDALSKLNDIQHVLNVDYHSHNSDGFLANYDYNVKKPDDSPDKVTMAFLYPGMDSSKPLSDSSREYNRQALRIPKGYSIYSINNHNKSRSAEDSDFQRGRFIKDNFNKLTYDSQGQKTSAPDIIDVYVTPDGKMQSHSANERIQFRTPSDNSNVLAQAGLPKRSDGSFGVKRSSIVNYIYNQRNQITTSDVSQARNWGSVLIPNIRGYHITQSNPSVSKHGKNGLYVPAYVINDEFNPDGTGKNVSDVITYVKNGNHGPFTPGPINPINPINPLVDHARIVYEDQDNNDRIVGSYELKGHDGDLINYNYYDANAPHPYYFDGQYGFHDLRLENGETDVIYVRRDAEDQVIYKDKKSGRVVADYPFYGHEGNAVEYDGFTVRNHVPRGYRLVRGHYQLPKLYNGSDLIVWIEKPNKPKRNHRKARRRKPVRKPTIKRHRYRRRYKGGNVPLAYKIVYRHGNHPYLIVSRGPKVIRIIDLGTHKVQKVHRRLPQTNERTVHTSAWAAVFATAAALIGGFGKAVDRRKH